MQSNCRIMVRRFYTFEGLGQNTHKGNYNTNRQNIKNKTIEYYFEKNGTTTKNPLIRQILNIIILKE